MGSSKSHRPGFMLFYPLEDFHKMNKCWPKVLVFVDLALASFQQYANGLFPRVCSNIESFNFVIIYHRKWGYHWSFGPFSNYQRLLRQRLWIQTVRKSQINFIVWWLFSVITTWAWFALRDVMTTMCNVSQSVALPIVYWIATELLLLVPKVK